MNLVDTLLESLFDNLFPGANYQRLITVLELLSVLHQCFFAIYNPNGMNKGSAIGNPEKLVQFLQENHQKMYFYTEGMLCRRSYINHVALMTIFLYFHSVIFRPFDLFHYSIVKLFFTSATTSLNKPEQAIEIHCNTK